MCKHVVMLAAAALAPESFKLHRPAAPADEEDAPAPYPKTFYSQRAKPGKGTFGRLAHMNVLHPTATYAQAVCRGGGARPDAASHDGVSGVGGVGGAADPAQLDTGCRKQAHM